MNTGHDFGHPVHLAGDPVGRSVQVLGLREEGVDTVNAMSQSTLTQRAIALAVSQDSFHICMLQNVGLIGSVVVEDVMLHFSVSFFIIFVIGGTTIFQSLADNGVNSVHLFLVQGTENITDGLLSIVLFCRLGVGMDQLFIRIHRFLLRDIAMTNFKIESATSVNDSLFITVIIVAVLNDVFDERARISTGQYEAYFFDIAMKYVASALVLRKMVSINRQCFHIAMHNQLSSLFARLAIIERTVGIYAFGFVLKRRLTQAVERIVVLMVPYQRDHVAVIVLESISTNRSTIGTP